MSNVLKILQYYTFNLTYMEDENNFVIEIRDHIGNIFDKVVSADDVIIIKNMTNLGGKNNG